MKIEPMTAADAGRVGQLHAATITAGFLNRLGPRFLRQLYLGIAGSDGCDVLVARGEDGRVVGFCAVAADVGGLYKRVLRARFWRLGFASLPYSLNPWVIKEAIDTLRYPAKQGEQALPPAEILSIGVDPSTRGSGVGRQLLEAALVRAGELGVIEIKVVAGAGLDAANKFYPRCGFAKIAELVQHGEPLNVYVKQLAEPGS